MSDFSLQIFNLEYNIGSKKVKEQIEVDEETNSAKFYLDKGGLGMIDYDKVRL